MTDPLVGRVLNDTYRIVRPLARGGMGAIYVAEHARLAGKRYAIKMLHAMFAADETVFQRFRREAEIASQLGHEHIVEVHDFNVTQDHVAYMVMEYLDGEDLSARIARGALPLGEVIRIVTQVASALAATHAAGIVHRDLKPQNIFLIRRGNGDFVKVLDFGISKVRDSSSLVTADQSVMGTPFYMSPEQAMGRVRDVDARTDVFALGAIVWEMLTGQMAFASDTIPGALYKVVHEEPRPVHELRGDLPPSVTAALARAMEKDRAARTPSVQEFASELSRASASSLPQFRASQVDVAPRRNTPTTMSQSVGQLTGPAASTPFVQPPRRIWPVAVGGALVAIAIAIVVLARGKHEVTPTNPVVEAKVPDAPPSPPPSPTSIAASPAPSVAASPAPTSPTSVATDVTLRFAIKPSDARVLVGGRMLDGTELVRSKSTEPLHVKVTADNHATWEGDVVPDQDRVVAIELVPQKRSHGSSRKHESTSSSTSTPALPPPQPVRATRSSEPPPAAPTPTIAPRPLTPASPPPPSPSPQPRKKGGTIFD